MGKQSEADAQGRWNATLRRNPTAQARSLSRCDLYAPNLVHDNVNRIMGFVDLPSFDPFDFLHCICQGNGPQDAQEG